MATAQDVFPQPYLWQARGAFSFPDIWATVEKHRPSNFPISTALFVTICFEETACCNIIQGETPAAMGPGQFQISQPTGVNFFAAQDNGLGVQLDSSKTLLAVRKDDSVFKASKAAHPELPPLTTSRILNDNDFSIKMHLKFFEWLHLGRSNGERKGLDGLLAAQTGGNAKAMDAFKKGAAAIEAVMGPDSRVRLDWTDAEWNKYLPKRRFEWANALNTAKTQFRNNAIGFKSFQKFWEFLLPDEFLKRASLPH